MIMTALGIDKTNKTAKPSSRVWSPNHSVLLLVIELKTFGLVLGLMTLIGLETMYLQTGAKPCTLV